MSVDENKNIVRRYIEEIINTGHIEKIENYISEDYTEIFDGKKYKLGVSGAIEHVKGVRSTYEDLSLSIDGQIGEGDYVVTSITAKGVHKGKWMGIKPTGKAVTFTGVNIDKVINGKIVEHGGAANLFGPLLEIGAIMIVRDSENQI